MVESGGPRWRGGSRDREEWCSGPTLAEVDVRIWRPLIVEIFGICLLTSRASEEYLGKPMGYRRIDYFNYLKCP